MMRRLLIATALVATATAALFAQTLTAKLTWTTTDSVTNAQTGTTYALKLNGTTSVPMGAVTCAAVGTPAVTTCSAPLTPPLAPGSYTLTVSNAFGSATSDPLIGAGPGKPTITIVITVTED